MIDDGPPATAAARTDALVAAARSPRSPSGASSPTRPPVLSMAEAVRRLTHDASEILIGGFAYSDPVAFAHELVRQGRRDLRIVKSAGGVLVDQLIGAGCVRELVTAHVWNSVGPRPAHAFRRAVEHGVPTALALEELSFGSLTMALFAGAAGLPFMPTTPARGTGHDAHRSFLPEKLAEVTSPFDGVTTTVVAPLAPELGVFHVRRVDELGNAQVAGPVADFRPAAAACRRIVVVAEEAASTEEVRRAPELTVIPGFMVDAVVVEPWSAHPTDVYGLYGRDLEFHASYAEMTASVEGMERYLDEHVRPARSAVEFVDRLDPSRRATLLVDGARL